MSTHIGANKGDIAKTILLPGDPLRAKFIAETFLENPKQYNNVRGMLGYTGTYKGVEVSVQGTGMGIPSISIYVHELIHEYGVKNLMRVGSCGSMQEHVKIRDVILASSASTTSSINKNRFRGMDFAPTANFELLHHGRRNPWRGNGSRCSLHRSSSGRRQRTYTPDSFRQFDHRRRNHCAGKTGNIQGNDEDRSGNGCVHGGNGITRSKDRKNEKKNWQSKMLCQFYLF